MRRIVILLTAVLFIYAAAPVNAQNIVKFTTAQCDQPFACAQTADIFFLLQKATVCASSKLNFPSGKSYFQPSSSLDSSGCLTSTPVEKTSSGYTMFPKCCVQASADQSSCQLQCSTYGTR